MKRVLIWNRAGKMGRVVTSRSSTSSPSIGCSTPRWFLAAVIALPLLLASPALAEDAPPQGPEAYKKMSLTELMDLDVTSVAKQPEPYRQAPAAIQVITGEDI